MTYAVNQLIRVGDYNSFAGVNGTGAYFSEPAGPTIAQGGNIGIMFGPGYGSYGYNQSVYSLSGMTTGDIIRTSHWVNLRNVLAFIRQHQLGFVDSAIPPASAFTTGHIIQAHESSPPTSNPYDFDSVISGALASRFTMALGTLFNLGTVTRGSPWGSGGSAIQTVIRASWGSADAAGFFFNTGGYIRFNFSQPVATSQDADWADAFTNRIAAIQFGAASTANGGSTFINSFFGFYNCTGSYQTAWFTLSSNGYVNANYANNSVGIEAKVNGFAANGRPGSSIDFRITCTDAHTGPIDGVSAGTAVTMSAVKDIANLVTIPDTPSFSVITPW